MIKMICHELGGFTTESEYDSAENRTKFISYNDSYNDDCIIHGFDWEYDSMGNLTKYTEYRWDKVYS